MKRKWSPVPSRRFYKRAKTGVSALSAAENLIKMAMRSWKSKKTARASKFRGSGSRSRTYTKKKKSDVTNTDDASGLISKRLGEIRMYRRYPKHIKTVGRYFYHVKQQFVMAGVQGQQTTNYPLLCATRNQIYGNALSTNRDDKFSWDVSPWELNPFSAPGTNSLFPGPAPNAIADNDVMKLKHVNLTMSVLGMSKLPQIVQVYFITPVYDTDVSPDSYWSNIVDTKNQTAVAQTVSSTLINNTAGTGQAAVVDWGANPWHHKEFRRGWRPLKSSKLVVQPGEQIDLRIKFDYEKIFDRNVLKETRQRQFLAGVTIVPMLIARCGVEGVALIEGGEAQEIAYGKPKVGVITDYHYTFQALPKSRVSTNLSFTGTLVNTTEYEKFIDDDEKFDGVGQL